MTGTADDFFFFNLDVDGDWVGVGVRASRPMDMTIEQMEPMKTIALRQLTGTKHIWI